MKPSKVLSIEKMFYSICVTFDHEQVDSNELFVNFYMGLRPIVVEGKIMINDELRGEPE
jgi:hypothetical protein